MTRKQAFEIIKDMYQASKNIRKWVEEDAELLGNKELARIARNSNMGSAFDFLFLGSFVAFPTKINRMGKEEIAAVIARGEKALMEANEIHNKLVGVV